MKPALFIAGLLMLSTVTYSQQNRFTLGVEGGISLANLSADGDGSLEDVYDSRTGYAAGIALQYNFPKVISLRTGIMYELTGASFDIPISDNIGNIIATGTTKDNIDYLVVPLLLRATFGDKINFFVNAGPYWAMLLNRIWVLENVASNYSGNEIDLTDETEKTDFGISAGLGASAVFNERIVISLEARNNMGMTDIDPHENELKTRTILILAGVAFKFGSRENDVK